MKFKNIKGNDDLTKIKLRGGTNSEAADPLLEGLEIDRGAVQEMVKAAGINAPSNTAAAKVNELLLQEHLPSGPFVAERGHRSIVVAAGGRDEFAAVVATLESYGLSSTDDLIKLKNQLLQMFELPLEPSTVNQELRLNHDETSGNALADGLLTLYVPLPASRDFEIEINLATATARTTYKKSTSDVVAIETAVAELGYELDAAKETRESWTY